jgi:hypothetical protein
MYYYIYTQYRMSTCVCVFVSLGASFSKEEPKFGFSSAQVFRCGCDVTA